MYCLKSYDNAPLERASWGISNGWCLEGVWNSTQHTVGTQLVYFCCLAASAPSLCRPHQISSSPGPRRLHSLLLAFSGPLCPLTLLKSYFPHRCLSEFSLLLSLTDICRVFASATVQVTEIIPCLCCSLQHLANVDTIVLHTAMEILT